MNSVFSDPTIGGKQLICDLAELLEMTYDDFVLGLSEPLPNEMFGRFAGRLFRHHLKENNPVAVAAVNHPTLRDFALKLLLLSQVSEKDFADFADVCGVARSVLLDWSVGKDSSFDFENNRIYQFEQSAAGFANASPELQKTLLLNRALAPLASRLLLGSRKVGS
jgi:hypothetical protein